MASVMVDKRLTSRTNTNYLLSLKKNTTTKTNKIPCPAMNANKTSTSLLVSPDHMSGNGEGKMRRRDRTDL